MAQMVKTLPAVQETWVQPLGQEDPLEREWLPTPIFLPREFHGHRSLAGYSPWGRRVGRNLVIKQQQQQQHLSGFVLAPLLRIS